MLAEHQRAAVCPLKGDVMQIQALGMVWYKAENYERLRATFDDGETLPASYEKWLSKAEVGRAHFEATGVRVVCVDIDPDEFPRWCKEEGLRQGAHARNMYASLIAYRSVAGGSAES